MINYNTSSDEITKLIDTSLVNPKISWQDKLALSNVKTKLQDCGALDYRDIDFLNNKLSVQRIH